jgi:hypothetical protein
MRFAPPRFSLNRLWPAAGMKCRLVIYSLPVSERDRLGRGVFETRTSPPPALTMNENVFNLVAGAATKAPQ